MGVQQSVLGHYFLSPAVRVKAVIMPQLAVQQEMTSVERWACRSLGSGSSFEASEEGPGTQSPHLHVVSSLREDSACVQSFFS